MPLMQLGLASTPWVPIKVLCGLMGQLYVALHCYSYNCHSLSFSDMASLCVFQTPMIQNDFDNWGYGEPNNYNDNEHCAEAQFYYGRHWNDRHCESYNDWICQIGKGNSHRVIIQVIAPQSSYIMSILDIIYIYISVLPCFFSCFFRCDTQT